MRSSQHKHSLPAYKACKDACDGDELVQHLPRDPMLLLLLAWTASKKERGKAENNTVFEFTFIAFSCRITIGTSAVLFIFTTFEALKLHGYVQRLMHY